MVKKKNPVLNIVNINGPVLISLELMLPSFQRYKINFFGDGLI